MRIVNSKLGIIDDQRAFFFMTSEMDENLQKTTL